MRSPWRAMLTATVLLTLAVAVLGCGSKKESTTTTTTSTSASATTAAWANGLCSSLVTWKSSLTSATKTVTSAGVSKSNLQQAADDVSAANSKLQDDVNSLGKPPTPAASDAKTAVQQLESQLKSEAGRIKDAVSGVSSATDVAGAVSTTKSALTAMGDDLSSTAKELGSLPGESEWNEAFAKSKACGQLTNG